MDVKPFIDPRDHPTPTAARCPARTTDDAAELAPLHRLCREGCHYDVERWIGAGKPLQLTLDAATRQRTASALDLALDARHQGLLLLLLCNGYDPDLEPGCALDSALASRRWDLLDLLLEWGADPHRVDLETLFGTYDSKLFERFKTMGVDLTDDLILARTLGSHTSNKPLFGFVRRHRLKEPGYQRALDMALVLHAGRGNEKGVLLSLWAGANPHAAVPNLRYLEYGWKVTLDEDDEDFDGETAIHVVCAGGHAELLRPLRPDPALDDFNDLYETAMSAEVIRALARIQPPPDDDYKLLARHLWWATMGTPGWRATETLAALFEQGLRWRTGSKSEIATARQCILKAPDNAFVSVMKLLAENDNCTPEIRAELARTPAVRAKMEKVGFIPRESDDRWRYVDYRPTGSREVLRKFGVVLPKPAPPPLPHTIWIGARRPGSAELRMTRVELFDRVWTTPVSRLSQDWGLSGPGLAKACRRLKIPVPPRGYWAKKEAGSRTPRRPTLPALPDGQAEEVVIHTQRASDAGKRGAAT